MDTWEIVKLCALISTGDDELNAEPVWSSLTYEEIFILNIEADSFFGTIHILHGSPTFLITYRNLVFTGGFSHKLLQLVGTQLRHSSACHPQLDGRLEKLNQGLLRYVGCIVSMIPKQWLTWILLAKYLYQHSHILLNSYLDSSNTKTSNVMTYIQNLVPPLKDNFKQVPQRQNHELVQRFPEMDACGNYKIEHFAALGIYFFTKKGEHTSEILTQWLNAGLEFATWNDEKHICCKLPPFDPCGQGASSGGGIVKAHIKEEMKEIEVE